MTIETEDDLHKLRDVGRVVALALKTMMAKAEPGITTAELDRVGRAVLEEHGARSAPELCYQFPGATCISINEEAAHGIPCERALAPGDVVNVDVSAEKDGYYADTGGTFVVPPSDALKNKLIASTRQALRNACGVARAGKPLNGIGKAIQKTAKRSGFRVIRNLCSHGIGRRLHEEPKEVPGYYEPRDKRVLHKGLVMTIEPFLSTRSRHVDTLPDGWTLVGQAGNLSAQFEHTLVITDGAPILLTRA